MHCGSGPAATSNLIQTPRRRIADEEFAEDYPDDTPAVVEDETVAAPTETVDSDAAEVAEEDSNPR